MLTHRLHEIGFQKHVLFVYHQSNRKLTGTTPSALRIWELRYGWPKPERKANGFRVYNASEIEDLKWAATCIANGKSIRDLIDDDSQLIKKPQVTQRKTVSENYDFSRIPLPKTSEGRRIREQCEQALRIVDHGKIAFLQNLAVRLHPAEREPALEALVKKVITEKRGQAQKARA